MKNLKLFVTLLFVALSLPIFAQRPALHFKGTVMLHNQPMAGVRVYISDAGAITADVVTDAKGKFEVQSFYNKLLSIVVEKDGFVTQNIFVNTRLTGMAQEDMNMKVSFDMYQQSSGTVLKFEEPIGKIAYDYTANKFAYDAVYQQEIKVKLDALHKELNDAAGEAQPTK